MDEYHAKNAKSSTSDASNIGDSPVGSSEIFLNAPKIDSSNDTSDFSSFLDPSEMDSSTVPDGSLTPETNTPQPHCELPSITKVKQKKKSKDPMAPKMPLSSYMELIT